MRLSAADNVGLFPLCFDKAQQLFDQYGSEERFRRFREMNPEVTRQWDRPPNPPQAGRKREVADRLKTLRTQGAPARDAP